MPERWLMLVLVLVWAGLLGYLAAVAMVAWSLVHPARMTDAKALWLLRRLSPADLGMEFEELRFEIREADGNPFSIAAWWLPHEQSDGRCAVLVHGYADAKVGALAWAPVWHSLGFNLLLPDLRAHGESGGSACTAGCLEARDLSQVLDELRAQRPGDTRQIVLFGVSMGAAVAAATAVRRCDIAAVVMESPYADFRHAAMAHMDRLGLPGAFLQRPALRLAEWITGSHVDQVCPVDLIARLTCPVLLVESGADSFLSDEDREALRRAVRERGGRSQLRVVDGVEHLGALAADPSAYASRLQSFVADILPAKAALPADLRQVP